MLKINMKNTKKEIFKSFDKNLIYKKMVKILSLHEIKTKRKILKWCKVTLY